MAVATQILVGMADIQVTKDHAPLTCLGLGSCIGLVVFDPLVTVAGMVHIMLPESFKDKPVDKLGKFANTGIPELIRLMEERGAAPQRFLFAYAGGAQVFKFGTGVSSKLDVGCRNADAVLAHLESVRARVIAKDVGGSSGRTVVFDPSTGILKVRTVQGGERILCNLKVAA